MKELKRRRREEFAEILTLEGNANLRWALFGIGEPVVEKKGLTIHF